MHWFGFSNKIKKKHHILCFKRSFYVHWDSASLRLVKELAVLIVNTQKKFFGILAELQIRIKCIPSSMSFNFQKWYDRIPFQRQSFPWSSHRGILFTFSFLAFQPASIKVISFHQWVHSFLCYAVTWAFGCGSEVRVKLSLRQSCNSLRSIFRRSVWKS